ncbi:steroid membrane receptor 25- [Stylonychia lemnae]|uniref:Steroid membrane receptor 25 n=1 Tax=Stylonychia lemnae TaxID=5949 RepID=A0A078B5F2_STYLE|nr:steroid membrane receptor 25- [Stylonychia lemnae]|eukprot:CDW88522.1 steroid membrane receptor 25- [Stylonychia lemnae]
MNDAYQASRNEFDPMYYLIGFGIFVLLYLVINKDKKKPAKEPELDPRKNLMSKEELRQFDGNGPTKQIYIACNELIFDVTGSDFYEPGGDYAKFAGRDLTMAAANYSTDDKYLDMDYSPEMLLPVNQEQNIQGFFINFCQKYRIVGKLVINRKEQ